jgi:general secretion pathway protein J
LQRVAYQLSDGKLSRHFWLVLDRAEDSEAVVQDLIDGVESFQISLLNEDGEGTDVWPDFNSEAVMPLAMEIIIATKTHGDVRRVFVLPSAALSFQTVKGNENSDDSGDGGGTEERDNAEGDRRESQEDDPDE